MYKCVILVRMDLKMSRGKVVAQAGHGIVSAVMNSSREKLHEWMECGEKIVTLKVNNMKTMQTIHDIAIRKNVYSHIVTDAGHTEVAPGTQTICVIGPDIDTKIDKLTGQLKLF